jgi:hypothetical protein
MSDSFRASGENDVSRENTAFRDAARKWNHFPKVPPKISIEMQLFNNWIHLVSTAPYLPVAKMETGVYISENNPLPWGKNISQYQLGEKM